MVPSLIHATHALFDKSSILKLFLADLPEAKILNALNDNETTALVIGRSLLHIRHRRSPLQSGPKLKNMGISLYSLHNTYHR